MENSLNELTVKKIPQFKCGDTVFSKSYLFTVSNSDRALLLSENGSSFLGDKRILSKITDITPTDDLLKKLKTKGFSVLNCPKDCRNDPVHLPTFFIIDFTTKCNMNCYYCLRHFEDSGETISFDQLKDILNYIVAYCKKHRVNDIDVQPWGGEPLLALDRIVYMRQFLADNGIRANIAIQTNGLLLTKENIDTLEKYNIGVGISIDGCRDIHDLHRKTINDHNTYDRVAESITRYAEQTGKCAGTISVISKMSLDYLDESIDTLIRNLNVFWLKLNFMHPNSELFDDSSVLDEDDIVLFWDKVIKKLCSLYRDGFIATEGNLSDKALNLVGCGGSDLCHSRGCTGGYKFVSFSQNGDIFPCEMIGIPEYRLGSIFDGEDLPSLIFSALPSNPYFKKKVDAKCNDCPWYSFCRGGCTAAARFNRKKPGEIDDKECASNRTIYPRLIQILLEEPSLFEALTNSSIRFGE